MLILQLSVFFVFFTHHDEPRDESHVPHIPEASVIDVSLHLQEEEEALIDDVGDPAKHSRAEKTRPSAEDPFMVTVFLLILLK